MHSPKECRVEPIILEGGLRNPASGRPASVPSIETPQDIDEPTNEPEWDFDDNGTLKIAPSVNMDIPAPGKTVTTQVAIPPTGKRTVALNPQIYLLYNAAQARWQYDRTFDQFIEEGMELLFELLGYRVAVVPAEWVSAIA